MKLNAECLSNVNLKADVGVMYIHFHRSKPRVREGEYCSSRIVVTSASLCNTHCYPTLQHRL
ncbi:hypothetical protein J6590_084961 [Homalodisca vitripennis]|nr:hypothetical protein J6590_084961 [Homalodisca vitripennis]